MSRSGVAKDKKFINAHIVEYCKEWCIFYETSAARTPQQTSVNERRNKTLKEKARTMLAENNVPQRFWAEAINTVCFTQNRSLLIKRHGKPPYEVRKGKTPYMSFFRVFCCRCFIHETSHFWIGVQFLIWLVQVFGNFNHKK